MANRGCRPRSIERDAAAPLPQRQRAQGARRSPSRRWRRRRRSCAVMRSRQIGAAVRAADAAAAALLEVHPSQPRAPRIETVRAVGEALEVPEVGEDARARPGDSREREVEAALEIGERRRLKDPVRGKGVDRAVSRPRRDERDRGGAACAARRRSTAAASRPARAAGRTAARRAGRRAAPRRATAGVRRRGGSSSTRHPLVAGDRARRDERSRVPSRLRAWRRSPTALGVPSASRKPARARADERRVRLDDDAREAGESCGDRVVVAFGHGARIEEAAGVVQLHALTATPIARAPRRAAAICAAMAPARRVASVV